MTSAVMTKSPTDRIFQRFSRWEIALFIRHCLREVLPHDQSYIDRLIELAGPSLMDAVFACTLVTSGPETPIASRFTHHPHPVPIVEETFQLLKKAEARAVAQSKDNSKSDDKTITVGNFPDLSELHRRIALVCLRIMNESLHFNMCSIPSSYLRTDNTEAHQLFREAQRNGRITPALLYACSHWTSHAGAVTSDQELTELVISFLEEHALHWLELMILSGQDPQSILVHLHELRVSAQTVFQ